MIYSQEEQLAKLKRLLNINTSTKDALLIDYLDDAMAAINLKRRFRPTVNTPLESRYFNLQVRLAACAYNKRGMEGQTTYNENGLVRTYEKGNVYPASMMAEVTPLVR